MSGRPGGATVLCIPHAQDLVRGGPGCVVCVLEADNERLRGLYNTATLEREAAWRREDERRSRLAEAERDSQRLDWLERHLFEGKWDGTIGRPKSWYMAGPYRHTLQRMRGDALREAIDLAMQADSATHRENERE